MRERQYIVINLEAFPPGWLNSQRHNGRRALENNLGRQYDRQAHLQTHSRVVNPALLDEDKKVIDDPENPTEEIVIIIGVFTDEELQRSNIVNILATELEVNPVAVDNKIDYFITNLLGIRAEIAKDPEKYGERLIFA